MSAYKRKKTVLFTRGWLVAIISALGILAFAIAVYSFIRFRQTGSLYVDASQSQVVISHPGNMAQFPAGSPIQVEVSATGQKPFTSSELWINGVLEGVQAGPPPGLPTLGFSFSWIPASSGTFSLVARAINLDNATAVSSAVIVFVNPSEKEDQSGPDAGQAYPAVLPAAPAGEINPPAPAPGDAQTPAVEWQGSPADWLTNLTASSVPAAPELAVAADGCSVKLDIHDLSDNEEGFVLYRQTTASPYWVHVADLASHFGKGWIETQDPSLSGGITYYVDAFNSKGQTSSNLALVNIDPQACPAPKPSSNLPVLDLKVQNLSITDGTENAYCYTNQGGKYWSRWPEFGFIAPVASGQNAQLLGAPLLLASLGDSGINPGPQSMDLKLECWGWRSGTLLSLGQFSQKIDLVSPHAIHVALTGLAFDVLPDVITAMKNEKFKLGASFAPGESLVKDPFTIENLGYFPESDQMPRIAAEVTENINHCRDHVQDPSYKDAYCAPAPGFNAGPGGVNPQPFLVWDVLDGFCKATGQKECLSLSWWEGFAREYPDPYRPGVFFDVEATFFTGEDYEFPVGWQTDADQRALKYTPDFPFGQVACDHSGMILTVAMVVNTSFGTFQGAPSQWIQTVCPKALGNSVLVEVNFNQLTLAGMDEPANSVYGQFAALPNGQPATHLLIGWWNGESPATPYLGPEQSSNGYIGQMDNGTYPLSQLKLCTAFGGVMCPFTATYDYFTNNNVLVVTLRGGDALQLFSELYDYNTYSSDDHICDGNVWVGPRTIEEWAATVNESILLIQPEGHAYCSVEVILSAREPGPD
jgi:hypothetical protein